MCLQNHFERAGSRPVLLVDQGQGGIDCAIGAMRHRRGWSTPLPFREIVLGIKRPWMQVGPACGHIERLCRRLSLETSYAALRDVGCLRMISVLPVGFDQAGLIGLRLGCGGLRRRQPSFRRKLSAMALRISGGNCLVKMTCGRAVHRGLSLQSALPDLMVSIGPRRVVPRCALPCPTPPGLRGGLEFRRSILPRTRSALRGHVRGSSCATAHILRYGR